MPGLELFGSSETAPATTIVEVPAAPAPAPAQVANNGAGPYYNARLDPKNYLEGPLSLDPCTRLRQMLARPGIVVSSRSFDSIDRPAKQIWQVAPGICDGISARCALEAGFECLYQRFVPHFATK